MPQQQRPSGRPAFLPKPPEAQPCASLAGGLQPKPPGTLYESGALPWQQLSPAGQLVQPEEPHCCSGGGGGAAASHGGRSVAAASPGQLVMLRALSAPAPPHLSCGLPVQLALQPVDLGIVYGPKLWAQLQSPPASSPAIEPTVKPALQHSATHLAGDMAGSAVAAT